MSHLLPEESPPTNLSELQESYLLWKTLYQYTRQQFERIGNKRSLILLDEINRHIEDHRTQWRVLEKLNYEKLSRMAKTPRYPLSIVTWLEDEMKDIWEGLS